MPGVFGVTVVTCLRAFYFCTQGCGRVERPAFPAPSIGRGREVQQNSGAMRGENARLYPAVIAIAAIHEAARKQEWIASLVRSQ
jgi:hypothetical protein